MIIIKGVPASSGIAIGRAYVHEDDELVVEKRAVARVNLKDEVKRFRDALRMTNSDLDAAEKKVLSMLGRQHAKLIDAHRLILKDPLITQEVPARILREEINAEYALSQTLEQANRNFEKIDDEFFRERRHDLFDVGKRLIRHLVKHTRKSLSDIKDPVVLVAHNLYPSDTIHLRESEVLGFCTDIGGKTSHTALLAQSMEIPAVVGLSDVTRQIKNGDIVIIDGDRGLVLINPGPEALDKYQKLKRKEKQDEKNFERVRELPSITRDGRKVSVMLNLDPREDIRPHVLLKPDGVGLIRTESIYMNRTVTPSEQEHFEIYTLLAGAFAGKPVTIRLADIGGDKLAALGIGDLDKEANPFMGLRGIRLFLKHSDLLKLQLRAVLRAAQSKNIKIMIPMVTTISEVRHVRRVIDEIYAEFIKAGEPLMHKPQLGIMVEVPSAAITIDGILPEIDFVSIGTNDLIQYLLAVDRVNQHVAEMYDSYNPAVIRIIHLIVQSAHKKGKEVSVCGEMASDTVTAALLVGLGVDTLSVPPRRYYKIKHMVRGLSFAKCSSMAQQALLMASGEDVRELIYKALDETI
ncbi:MAG: phosphoenolpyruvate--protein phosphotransferase [Elusimicrobiaceae bacterium]|nr:phosphoenolpyruvate--protein phosphotransferase [Elusimicrobiaceae bacterium]